MDRGILDTFKNSGDANIGQTLLRLARLAESAHQFERNRAAAPSARKEQARAEGFGPGHLVPTPSSPAGTAHTEVTR